jgi:hypothetical protein
MEFLHFLLVKHGRRANLQIVKNTIVTDCRSLKTCIMTNVCNTYRFHWLFMEKLKTAKWRACEIFQVMINVCIFSWRNLDADVLLTHILTARPFRKYTRSNFFLNPKVHRISSEYFSSDTNFFLWYTVYVA